MNDLHQITEVHNNEKLGNNSNTVLAWLRLDNLSFVFASELKFE